MYQAPLCRVVIIGCGRVGSHCAMSLIPGRLADEIVLIDANKDLAEAQATDLADFSCGMGRGVTVRAGSYEDCSEASFVIIAAGRGRKPGETRLALLADTLGALTDIADNLSRTRFDGVLICITNPVDIATAYLSQKLGLPANQIMGTGTSLDTIRLKRILSERTGVDVNQIQGFCMGEHGDSSLIAWSHVSFGGVPLAEYLAARPELTGVIDQDLIQQTVHEAGGDIISGKGCTEFGVGSVVTGIIAAISRGETKILPLSAHLSGQYGEDGICAGTPCSVGAHGLEQVFEVALSPHEAELMRASCAIIRARLAEIS